jgi:signal transduction histidine kinase/ActR/RegA family two-component response regulator
MADSSRRPLASPSLGAKLVAFSVLLTALVVAIAFLFLSVEIRRHTQSLLAATLAQHQRTILSLQQKELEEVVRTSTLMTDSPTLRAAIETYRSESAGGARARGDLLATIQNEVDKVAAGLGRDLLVVTDRSGAVLAAFGSPAGGPRVGEAFGSHRSVRRALDQDAPVGPENFAALALGDAYFHVGSVPILLQGFPIGTLTLGDRIDQGLVGRLQGSFDSDFVVAVDGRILGSTLVAPASSVRLPQGSPSRPGDEPLVVRIADEDYVTAAMTIGSDDAARPVRLYLLHSLTRAVEPSNRFLVLLIVSCGAVAMVLAGSAALWMSRSLLRPLDSFVRFMRSVAASGNHAQRFPRTTSCIEVATLNDAYDHLMDSLQAHEERLRKAAREEVDQVTRLKESEKLAALGRMLSGAAHEINNPLTGVVGNIELLLRSDGLDPAVRDRLEKVRREGQRVVSLVRRLLRVSYRETGIKVRLDLHDVLRESVDVRRHDFVSAGIALELDLCRAEAPVRGSALELQQVFLNIVNNAYDALLEASAPRWLRIRTDAADGRVAVTFVDNGPGMKDPRKVFDHFYTTKEVGKGTGLGLSICHGIVQDHGGRIAAENDPGGGARFLVELPLEAAAADARIPEAPSAAPEPVSEPLRASVLIVDDEPTIVELQKEILEALGAAVVGVASGSEAIAVLEKRAFDLIVTDLRMPGGVSGEDLYRWVASRTPTATRGFVFVTGDTAGETNRDFIETSGARCLLKPFSMAEYVRTLRETFHEIRPT